MELMVMLLGLLVVGAILACQKGYKLAQAIGFLALSVCIIICLMLMFVTHHA